jgi:hypothetical protein
MKDSDSVLTTTANKCYNYAEGFGWQKWRLAKQIPFLQPSRLYLLTTRRIDQP